MAQVRRVKTASKKRDAAGVYVLRGLLCALIHG
jgi:hypothetical protein